MKCVGEWKVVCNWVKSKLDKEQIESNLAMVFARVCVVLPVYRAQGA